VPKIAFFLQPSFFEAECFVVFALYGMVPVVPLVANGSFRKASVGNGSVGSVFRPGKMERRFDVSIVCESSSFLLEKRTTVLTLGNFMKKLAAASDERRRPP